MIFWRGWYDILKRVVWYFEEGGMIFWRGWYDILKTVVWYFVMIVFGYLTYSQISSNTPQFDKCVLFCTALPGLLSMSLNGDFSMFYCHTRQNDNYAWIWMYSRILLRKHHITQAQLDISYNWYLFMFFSYREWLWSGFRSYSDLFGEILW